jgi:hypothetical protein
MTEIVLVFDRPNVERMNLHEPLLALERMIAAPAMARELAGSVRVAFEGFEGGPEVYANPSVQLYIRELTEMFPYWLHFANKDDDTLFVLFCCLIPPQRVESGAEGKVNVAIDTSAWHEQLMRLFGFMNGLYERLGFSAEENSAMTRLVNDWWVRVTGPQARVDSKSGS